jgi:hypothetical protein
MKYHHWTVIDDIKLSEFYSKESAHEVSVRLGYNVRSVYRRAAKLGLHSCTYKEWTDEEVVELERLYKNTHVSEISKRIGRSVGAICAKACTMGLAKGKIKKSQKANILPVIPAKIKRLEWNGETDTIGRETGMIMKSGCEFVEWLGVKRAGNE